MNVDLLLEQIKEEKTPVLIGISSLKKSSKNPVSKIASRVSRYLDSVFVIKAEGNLGEERVSSAILDEKAFGLPEEKLRKKLIESTNAEYIFIEVPPVLESEGSLALLSCCDKRYLTVEYNKTRKPVIERAMSDLKNSGMSLDGFIFSEREYPIPTWAYRLLLS